MVNLFYCELLKLKRSKMLLISFLGALVTPLMMIADGVKIHYSNPETIITLDALYDSCSMYTMMLFGLIVNVVIAAYLFSREYTEKTLKTVLTIPVSKSTFILSKFIMLFVWVMTMSVITWASMFALAALYHSVFGLVDFEMMIAVNYLVEMVFGGILMFLIISPFAYLAIRTKGLVVPIIVAAAIAMGNVALSNEPLGALYPWTASYLWVTGRLAGTGYSYSLVIGIIALVSIFGFLATVVYFQKEDIK